jgi:hypothetical protein
MKNYLTLLILIVSLSACYPSDPEVSPFVGEWKIWQSGIDFEKPIIKITNEYFFLDGDLIPDYRYTMDEKAFYITQIWKPKEYEYYNMRCTYLYRNDTLFIHNFLYDSLIWEYGHVGLIKVEK